MPANRVSQDGKMGYRRGDKGTFYSGPDAKEKAERQGRAIAHAAAYKEKTGKYAKLDKRKDETKK